MRPPSRLSNGVLPWLLGAICFVAAAVGAYLVWGSPITACTTVSSASLRLCYPRQEKLTVNPDTGDIQIGSLLTLNSPLFTDHSMGSMRMGTSATPAPALDGTGFSRRTLGKSSFYFQTNADAVGSGTTTAVLPLSGQYVTASYPTSKAAQAERVLASITPS